MTSATNENETPSDHGHSFSDQARVVTSRVASEAGEMANDAARHYVREPARDLFSLAKDYAKDNPDVAACWAFGLGVLVGWKLRG